MHEHQKEFHESMLKLYKKHLRDYEEVFMKVSRNLKNETYLEGGWTEEFWLYIKKDIHIKIEKLKHNIEHHMWYLK